MKLFRKFAIALTLFLITICNFAFATSKNIGNASKEVDSILQGFNLGSGQNFSNLGQVISSYNPIVLVLCLIISIVIIQLIAFGPAMRKINQPLWKALIPFYGIYVYYNSANLGAFVFVAPILINLFVPGAAFLSPIFTGICNLLMSKKFTNYEGNYMALLFLFIFGPWNIAFGNHNYKGK